MQLDSDKINKINFNILECFTPNKELFVFLADKDRIDFIYNTAALEGNAMTYPEVQTLLEGVTVGGHKLSDEQQILNQNDSVNLLLEMIKKEEFKINKLTLLKLHEKVAFKEALSWGVFRNANVRIGGTEYLPPKSSELDKIFDEGIKELKKITHPIIRAITYFLFGAKCQFFYDGNKRTSRLMMNGILLKNGYPILNIKVKDKLEFNKQMLEFYDGGDIVKCLQYLIVYYHQQNNYLFDN